MGFYCNGMKGICSCDILCADCTYFNNSGGKEKQTNADRIRAMSDEELTKFINKIVICHHLRNEGYCEKCPIHPAKPCDTEGIIEWLRQPAETREE